MPEIDQLMFSKCIHFCGEDEKLLVVVQDDTSYDNHIMWSVIISRLGSLKEFKMLLHILFLILSLMFNINPRNVCKSSQ